MLVRNAFAAMALCAPLFLSGCGGSNNESGSDNAGLKTGVFSLFDPVAASATVPFPFDGFFSGSTDGTLNIPNSSAVPFVDQANLQDGFSTTASVFTDMLGTLDYSTLAQGLLVINSATGTVLKPGVDYTTQPSVATSVNPLSGQVEPISAFRSRVLIEPLKPLAPSTRYVVVLTPALKSVDGLAIAPSDLFKVVRSGTAVADQTADVLSTLTAAQKTTLETVRSSLIRPIVTQLAGFGLTEDQIVLTWSFTTQTIGNTLNHLQTNSVASQVAAKNTGATLAAFNAALPPIANVYFGTVKLPYYLAQPGSTAATITDPITQYWLADATKPDTSQSFLGQVPCGAFVTSGTGLSAPESTTGCFPDPVKRSDQTVPVLITVPNANSGKTMPANGWPVVIFQHGITGNRSQMLALAPALTLAGFAVVSIDLPLHGLPPDSPLRITGVPERTFDLDLQNNTTGASGPDGVVDASGTYFINLSSLITSRDNIRQAVSDLIVMSKSAGGTILVDTGGAPDGNKFDGTQVRFVGHSLGGIVGGTLLGVNTNIGAATLAMPGGGIAKLLDASVSFGPRIAAGLAASGVVEGTDDYETFLRFAQTLVDSADPINYAASAISLHPIQMIEVIGGDSSPADQVVPNSAPANAGTANNDKVTIAGFLSGTDPLYQQMGLTTHVFDGTAAVQFGEAAHGNVVQFTTGDHGSILSPAASATATAEMQKETASFLATNGLCLPIGGSCQ
jgi:pimeloyl-ACP methyl ester carboxylesterase